MKAPTQEWKYKGFFQTFSVADLEQALVLLEDEDRRPTLNRRKAIRAEIERRYEVASQVGIPVEEVIKAENYRDDIKEEFVRAPNVTNSLRMEWNQTCKSIYKKIQFRPEIPIVGR